MILEMCGT